MKTCEKYHTDRGLHSLFSGVKIQFGHPKISFEPRREKTGICICQNKDANQLRGSREADQGLCFRYMDSTIPLLPKSEISSVQPSSVVVQPGLCRTWSETPKTGFLTTRLILVTLEIQMNRFYVGDKPQRDEIANREDPDQTASMSLQMIRLTYRSSLIWVFSVCHDTSVQKL